MRSKIILVASSLMLAGIFVVYRSRNGGDNRIATGHGNISNDRKTPPGKGRISEGQKSRHGAQMASARERAKEISLSQEVKKKIVALKEGSLTEAAEFWLQSFPLGSKESYDSFKTLIEELSLGDLKYLALDKNWPKNASEWILRQIGHEVGSKFSTAEVAEYLIASVQKSDYDELLFGQVVSGTALNPGGNYAEIFDKLRGANLSSQDLETFVKQVGLNVHSVTDLSQFGSHLAGAMKAKLLNSSAVHLRSTSDFETALTWTKGENSTEMGVAIQRMFNFWAHYDPVTCSERLSAIESGTSKDFAVAGFVQVISSINPSLANSWASHISDLSLREIALKQAVSIGR